MTQELMDILEEKKGLLTGRKITMIEKKYLHENFNDAQYPLFLFEISLKYNIIGQIFQLDINLDNSALGVDMQWLDPHEQVEEALKYFPGIVAIQQNFIPIGKCLMGSGDPYFVKSDGDELIFRILHDSVRENKLDEKGIEYTCNMTTLIQSIG